MRATESCPENILSYQVSSIPFQVSLFDLLIPDRSAVTYEQIESIAAEPLYPFHFSFNSLPYVLTKKCLAHYERKRNQSQLGEGPEFFGLIAARL